MRLLEHLHRNVKTVAMPTGYGGRGRCCAVRFRRSAWTHQMITPTLIFLMLFVTFCRVKPRQMKPSMLHVWLLLFQTVVCIGVLPRAAASERHRGAGGDDLRAGSRGDGRGGHRRHAGANVATMATYSLLCNMAVALLAPVILTFTGTGRALSRRFWPASRRCW